MGSRSSSPRSSVDGHNGGTSAQRNKVLSQHVTKTGGGLGGWFKGKVAGKKRVAGGRKMSNSLVSMMKEKKNDNKNAKRSMFSPTKGAKKIAVEGRSKSEPTMRISAKGRYLSPFESPPAPNKRGVGGGTPKNDAERKLDESSTRERLLQVGRLSPVNPKTNQVKIPILKKAATTNTNNFKYLPDDHVYTGHVQNGTRSLNMELWYAACTRAGNTKKKVRKGNQDTFLMEDCLGGNPHLTLFGVFDGHGPVGDACSHYVRDCILEYIGAKNKILIEFSENSATKLIVAACRSASKKLTAYKNIDSQWSGCTGVLALVNSKVGTILHFNVGDSRLMLGRGTKKIADMVELTIDHDPDMPGETERILKAGGRIQNASGVKRVCLKNEDMPGLAMTRSYGDDIAASIGVNSEPDVGTRQYGKEDRFLILGSDGVFDFLSLPFISSTISEMFRLKKNPQEVAERLVCDAVKKWTSGKNDYVDDVTSIVVYLNAHPGRGAISL
mmetsp:Transcript_10802/g.22180  ORF Transcript_10802/g.22180 Transcript_10802/m.22180 type:complete len:498 (+) Transcript_10802:288-1781(+)|eukprot:CAMPEP_0118640186 /NCGR_PEP_ID=MMETSP0785-20121206/4619_1 /TAXON_ID=91992 /ORGANISM="Bolidomonas pacifica, Strain CCMP 1866" /LENGTH=497 /DNA_ID=CAMNT_0006531557 /DNA_START=336 /DNA_END=1829 /DNA_ORIENTATION=-